jgi:hypothetical protein
VSLAMLLHGCLKYSVLVLDIMIKDEDGIGKPKLICNMGRLEWVIKNKRSETKGLTGKAHYQNSRLITP